MIQINEQIKLAELHAACDVIRKNCFFRLANYLDMTDVALKSCGYSTQAEAALGAFYYAQTRISKLEAAYNKEFPDK